MAGVIFSTRVFSLRRAQHTRTNASQVLENFNFKWDFDCYFIYLALIIFVHKDVMASFQCLYGMIGCRSMWETCNQILIFPIA